MIGLWCLLMLCLVFNVVLLCCLFGGLVLVVVLFLLWLGFGCGYVCVVVMFVEVVFVFVSLIVMLWFGVLVVGEGCVWWFDVYVEDVVMG